MNSLPLELRRRIVEAYERGEGTYFELAQRFGVGEATVYRLVKLKRERGTVRVAAAQRGISEEELPEFVKLVHESPGATLDQLKQAWVTRTHCELSLSSVVRALRRAGIARKKVTARRGSRARPSRPGGTSPPDAPKKRDPAG